MKLDDLKSVCEENGIEWDKVKDLTYVNGVDNKVNFKQFFVAAKKGYSILDSKIFENLKDGIVVEKHLTKNPKIAYNKDLDWIDLTGRHNEIHVLLKCLSGKQE